MREILNFLLMIYFSIGLVCGIILAVMGITLRKVAEWSISSVLMASLLCIWVWPIYAVESVKNCFKKGDRK
jgi:hypothetical protein